MSKIIKFVRRILGIDRDNDDDNHREVPQSFRVFARSSAESKFDDDARNTRSYSPSVYQLSQSSTSIKTRPLSDSDNRPSRASLKKSESPSKSFAATSRAAGQLASCSSSSPKAADSDRPSRASLKKPESLSKSVAARTRAAGQLASCSSFSPAEPPPTSNPTLRPVSGHGGNRAAYVLDADSSLPLYLIPKDVEELIKNDVVPPVLRNPVSPITYKHYFAALLYAEDFYYKKWSNYKLESVSLELQEIAIHKRSDKRTHFHGEEKVTKTFVAFEIDSVPERRPFLLSRDLVHARLSGTNIEPFQGFVYRVGKSNRLRKRNVLLVDFGEDFHSWHHETNKYDISFTFNRVCLKRAHQAIEEASDSLFQHFLFPESKSRKRHPNIQVTHSTHLQQLDPNQKNAVHQISLFHSSPPYLIKGPPCIQTFKLSKTGTVVKGAVFQIYSTSPSCRILICAPRNTTCDELMISLKKVIPESDMFRATAAFRELDEVPDDILSSCDYDEEKECFTCPSLDELHKYKIIFSTFMSSFRLHAKGLAAGHFSHIFLLDASAAIEPESLVPLSKFATDSTAVIVTGQTGNQPYWVRSEIARRDGLKISYFQRLEERLPYRNLNPLFISEVGYEEDRESASGFLSAYQLESMYQLH